MLMLVLMAFTLMDGYSRLAEIKKISVELSHKLTNLNIKLVTTVSHFLRDHDLKTLIWLDQKIEYRYEC